MKKRRLIRYSISRKTKGGGQNPSENFVELKI